MTIEFHCPHCAKLLKTADDKAGVDARCPGCGQTITVPDSSSATAAESTGSGGDYGRGPTDSPDDSFPPGRRSEPDSEGDPSAGDVSGASPADTRKCPMCGARIKSAARICRFCGEEFRGGSGDRFDRSFVAPHRGGVVLALGIIPWPLSICCVIPLLGILILIVGTVMSIVSCVLAHSDLKQMDSGRMDPSGRGMTQAGRIISIIYLAFVGLGILSTVGFFVFMILSGEFR